MSAFDKIIGYENIKKELMQICDMIHNKEFYTKIGAKLPNGLLLSGDPGLGKTLMAKSFIEESGLKAFTIRRNKGNDDFIGAITETFEKAKESAPSIILLDDMDKFANEDVNHRDAEEYVAVQAGIDDVKNLDVFVIATVNEEYKLPKSLVRMGRFDRTIEIERPKEDDAKLIIEHYLSDKKVSDSVNMEDLTKMISYSSCAELETILNEAAINAAYERKEYIEMNDLVDAVLRMEYDSPDNYAKTSVESAKRTALHEAGHLVICEVLVPESVGLASIRTVTNEKTAGFIHRCKDLPKEYYHALVDLGGKAAIDLYYANECDSGSRADIENAANIIKNGIAWDADRGFGLAGISVSHSGITEHSRSRIEVATQTELERLLIKAKEILLNNRDFLEKTAEALVEKETLLYSDICEIKKKVKVIA